MRRTGAHQTTPPSPARLFGATATRFSFHVEARFFIILLHITIVHKGESRERLCDLANGMREVHSLREETILFFYPCIYLAFFAFCFLFGMFQNTRAGGWDTVCSPGRSVCILGSLSPWCLFFGEGGGVASGNGDSSHDESSLVGWDFL